MSASVGKRVGEALILSVYLAVDVLDQWPQSHRGCLALAFLGVIGILLLDGSFEKAFPIKRSVILGAISVAACFVIYLVAPVVVGKPAAVHPIVVTVPVPAPENVAQPRTFEGKPGIPFADTRVYGLLKPANLPTPKNGCDGIAGANAIKILLGDNGFTHSGFGSIVALGIKACHALVMKRRPDGVFASASLYDPDGQQVVSIRDNKITALNGENYIARQSRDGSRLTIRNSRGTELFFVRFLNPATLQARGFFGCKGGPIVHVRDGQPIPGLLMTNSCGINAAVGIQVGQP